MYMYTYIYVYVHIHIYMYVYILNSAKAVFTVSLYRLYIYIHTQIYVCVHIYIRICTYTHIYVYVYMCIHPCIYTSPQSFHTVNSALSSTCEIFLYLDDKRHVYIQFPGIEQRLCRKNSGEQWPLII